MQGPLPARHGPNGQQKGSGLLQTGSTQLNCQALAKPFPVKKPKAELDGPLNSTSSCVLPFGGTEYKQAKLNWRTLTPQAGGKKDSHPPWRSRRNRKLRNRRSRRNRKLRNRRSRKRRELRATSAGRRATTSRGALDFWSAQRSRLRMDGMSSCARCHVSEIRGG